MNPNYSLASTYNGLSGGIEEPIRYFKGSTEISIDLSDAAEGFFSIVKIIIDFNDNSPLVVREYTYGDPRKVVRDKFSNIYYPDPDFYHVVYYPTVYITYSNFKQFVYQMPVRISQESFYTEYKNLNIAATQFIDNQDDSTFLILDTAKGDNLNLRIK
jgi:hypothetical protein